MRAYSSAIGLGCVLWTSCVVMSQAASWPGFRGVGANGVAEQEKAPTFFSPTSNVVWATEFPQGHSSPVIWQDQMFLTGADGKKLITACLDRRSGKQRWERSVEVETLEPVHESNSHATATPVTDGKAVYVYFGSFGLLAFDLEGRELWRKPMPIPSTLFNQGSASSPILAEGKLLMFVQNGDDSQLMALNPANGQEIWKTPMPIYHVSWASPITWKEGDRGLVGVICAQRFSAFNLADGIETWWVNGLGYQACSTPVAVGDRLIITAAGVQGEAANVTPPPAFVEALKDYGRDGDGLIAFNAIPEDVMFTDRHAAQGRGNMSLKKALGMFGGVKEGDKLDREKWETIRTRLTQFGTGPVNQTVVLCARTGGKEDVTKSQVLWKETKGVQEVPSPLVWQRRLYLIRSGGILVCRDLETGKIIYENRLDAPGGYFASPVVADGRIYFASDHGTITIVKAGDAFEVVARNQLKDPIIASPVIVANTLYLRSAARIWAFGEGRN